MIDPEQALAWYRAGVFPMANSAHDTHVMIVRPDYRGVFPLDRFHIPRRLKRTVRQGRFEVVCDRAFMETIDGCAARSSTWINPPIRAMYADLFAIGAAHSVEAWRDGVLAGGLYGVCLGGAFFGESMFSLEADASKVALVHLVARLKSGGFRLLDAQFLTEHLMQFGAEEIPQETYLERLAPALAARPSADAFTRPMDGEEAVRCALAPLPPSA